MASPAVPGLFFCFAAMVLLIFASISSPTWDKISFLDVNNNGQETHFGAFGFTGSKTQIGYDIIAPGIPTNSNINTTALRNLTKAMILHPIAAALAGLAVIFGLCGAAYSRVGTIFMTISSALATVITLVIFVIDMVLWGILRNRIRDAGAQANYGNANWFVVGALVALLLGFCAGTCGSFGRYRRRRADRV